MHEIASNTRGNSNSIFDLIRCRNFLLSPCCCCCISLLFTSVEFPLNIFWLLGLERDRRVVDEEEVAAPLVIVCCGIFFVFSTVSLRCGSNQLDICLPENATAFRTSVSCVKNFLMIRS